MNENMDKINIGDVFGQARGHSCMFCGYEYKKHR
jgi:hypothetical protein